MPQMGPMNWLGLFIFFNAGFYTCVTKLFYLSKLLKYSSASDTNFLTPFFQTI